MREALEPKEASIQECSHKRQEMDLYLQRSTKKMEKCKTDCIELCKERRVQ